MNINDYRRAMDQIVPDTDLKERIMMEHKNGKRHFRARRAFTMALAAALAAACLCTVALAASPELRTAVLSFFHMEEREQVPSQNEAPSQPDISQAEIGQLVKAQYIKMDRYYGMSGDLLNDLTWSEDERTLLEAKFWEVKDNEAIPVQIDMQTAQIDVTYGDVRYRGELYWFIRNGELFLFKGTPIGVDARPEDEWYIEKIPGRTDAILLILGRGRQMDYCEYHFLYHLDTGEAEDILAGIDVAAPGRAYAYDWSEDLRRVVILYNPAPENEQTWVADLEAGTLTLLKDLTGIEAEFANFLDNDTLILDAYSVNEEDDTWSDMTRWVYDIPSGQAVKTLDRTPYYRWWDEIPYGVTPYSKNCLYVSEDGQVAVINMRTGERIPVEGFVFQKGDEFMISPSGNKLLYFHSDPDADGLGITQLGVVDMEKHTFIAFDREGYGDLYEEGIGWSDDNTVSINARTPDRETRYLLLYSF